MNINPHCTYEQWKRARWGFRWDRIAKAYNIPEGAEIVEVGVGPLDISILPYFSGHGFRLTGIDPNPEICATARAGMPDVTIIEKAVYCESGHILQLSNNSGSSGIIGEWMPTTGGKGAFDVETIDFAEIDSGNIAILNVDCEGSEHYVLEALKSRPTLIGIELWPQYPKAQWCENWLLDNGYSPIFATGPQSETQIWEKLC